MFPVQPLMLFIVISTFIGRSSSQAGWVALHVPLKPLWIGDDVTLTCEVRGRKLVSEVVFYKDDMELQRQAKPKLRLSGLTKNDQGVYWCRATWRGDIMWSTTYSSRVRVRVNDPSEMNPEP